MKFQEIQATTIEQLMIAHRGNISQAAKDIGINRGTLRRYIVNKENVLLVNCGGKLKVYVADRRNGQYKKGN